jgi:hypothetical protein
MTKTVRPSTVGSGYIIATWVFLAAAMIAGLVGVYRMTTAGAADSAAGCMCLGGLLGIIAAVLALLGIHKQTSVALAYIGPSYQGSHGSDDDT